jgi:hypothetical protein
LAVDWLDVRKQDLKLTTQLMADPSEHFGGDPSVVQSLKAFSQQMNEALIAIKEQKRFKREVSDVKPQIIQQISHPMVSHFNRYHNQWSTISTVTTLTLTAIPSMVRLIVILM